MRLSHSQRLAAGRPQTEACLTARVRVGNEEDAWTWQSLHSVELTYTALEALDYGSGGRLYGTMEGSLAGDKLRGTLRLTNLALRRPDNVNLPTLRGVLTTDDVRLFWVELDGVATLRPKDGARVFVTEVCLTLRDKSGR